MTRLLWLSALALVALVIVLLYRGATPTGMTPPELVSGLVGGVGLRPHAAEATEWRLVDRALSEAGLPSCPRSTRAAAGFDGDYDEAIDAFLARLENEGYEYRAYGHAEALRALEPGVLGGNTVFMAVGPSAPLRGAWTVDGLGGGTLYVCQTA